jgi:threonylcarbamoyladenosine tRNA methylthiotransferase MtaB
MTPIHTFKIITLGCKVNQYESAYLEEAFLDAGWRRPLPGETADVAIINTCIVTQRAAHQSRQAIRKAVRENPGGVVVAAGCYAQVFPQELTEIKGIGLIAGNRAKSKIPDILRRLETPQEPLVQVDEFSPGEAFECLKIRRFAGRSRAYLKIQDGCESFCSYCIVPFARGPYRSLPLAQVLSMLGTFAKEGYREVVLTGIHLGKYGYDLQGKTDLNALLSAIAGEGFPLRIRLSSLEPNEIDEDLLGLMAAEPWLCRHLHIPLQSGDDGILRRMNRRYTARDFAGLIRTVHDLVPLAAVGVDILAGFPGETSTAHHHTVSLIRDLPVSYLHVFPFSPRKGTPAADLNHGNDPRIIKERAQELRELGGCKKQAFYEQCLKKEFQVLAEAWHSREAKIVKGTSDNYLTVLFPSSVLPDRTFVTVQTERVEGPFAVGSMVSDQP